MAAGPRPTLRDIARLAEASPSTVSAVLSGAWRARRISAETAERVAGVARAHGYTANRQARALRRGRSEMIGLVLPIHDSRFFAALAQAFEAEARARGLFPVVASTRRDPAEERRTVETLTAYGVDALVIAGAADPDAVGAACRAAGAAHVYVDLPGRDAPSVVSDNYAGAAMLTRAILDAAPSGARPWFIGGDPADAATARRLSAFRAVTAEAGAAPDPERILTCGYAPARARAAFATLCAQLGRPPRALFVNSILVFEGVLSVLAEVPAAHAAAVTVGCYDYDPMAALLRIPAPMVRQNAEALMARAFALIDAGVTAPEVFEVAPELVPAGAMRLSRSTEFG